MYTFLFRWFGGLFWFVLAVVKSLSHLSARESLYSLCSFCSRLQSSEQVSSTIAIAWLAWAMALRSSNDKLWQMVSSVHVTFVLPVLIKVHHKVVKIWLVLRRIEFYPIKITSLSLSLMFLHLHAEKFLPTHTWKQWLSSEQSVLVKVGHSLPGPPFLFSFSCHRCSQRSVYHQLWSVGVTEESVLTWEWLVFCVLVNPPDITESRVYF